MQIPTVLHGAVTGCLIGIFLFLPGAPLTSALAGILGLVMAGYAIHQFFNLEGNTP
jgi:hypothetical protein